MVLYTKFANGQNYPFWNSTIATQPGLENNPFFKIDPIPVLPFTTLTTSRHILKFGENYKILPTRGIFYGGNLGVSQDQSDYGSIYGKWSFTGAWQRTFYYGAAPYPFTPGINYLVNYHRWGNYSAHFGLRNTVDYDFVSPNEGIPPPDLTQKDAVITWAYELGQPSNRLIFQSISGVHPPTGGGVNHEATEWATILSNGNIGSGTSNPTAQLQLKPLNPSGIPLMEMLDASNNPMFSFSKNNAFNIIGKQSIKSPPSSTDSFANFKIVHDTTEIFKITANGNTKIKGKLAINTFPVNDFDLAGIASIVGILGVTGTSSIHTDSAGSFPFLVSSGSTGTTKNLLFIGDRGTFYLKASTAGTIGSPVKLLDLSRYTCPACTTGATEDLFSIDDLGTAYLPKYTPGYLKVDAMGKIISSTIPFSTNTVWEVGGNDFSSSTMTQKIGGIKTASTTSKYNNEIDFYAGNEKAFELRNVPSSGEYGFTNFIRNVSIWGGTPTTGYGSGGFNYYNDKEWSLSVVSSVNPITFRNQVNYMERGILRCLDGDAQPVLQVGAKFIGFGNTCNGFGSPSTTDFQFGNCSIDPAVPVTYDNFNLMNTATIANNQMNIRGKLTISGNTAIAGNLIPYNTSTFNLGLSTNKWSRIYGNSMYGTDLFVSNTLNAESILPNTPATSSTGSDIGNISNHFDEIWGNTVYVDQVIPLNIGGTYTSDLGNPGNNFGTIYIQGTTITSSDISLKKDIHDFENGLKTIMQLKPKSYYYKESKDNKKYLGFIAQEVNEILPSIVYVPKNEKEHYALSYTELIPVLTKAVQEQQAIIESQNASIDSLNQKLNLVFASNPIKENKNIETQKESINRLPILFQNHPNPFNGLTFIDYFLPDNISDAFIRVIDNNGKLVKAFPINNTGFGQVELDCRNLAQGTYHYSLLVNSQIINAKSMVINFDNKN